MQENAWDYPSAAGYTGSDLTGFQVEALDGDIGKVDKHTDEVGSACLVVDTGPWIFGREVLIPAGSVTRVDTDHKKVFLDLTKDQVKGAPEFHRETHYDSADYRRQLTAFYWPPRI
ncbi:PRC-barrel domain-containing protein [Streptomyces sp. NPDC005953]|uniref:PRC-barrel domain-containing protein n=1 Tax=unclassified Streptomyces TaxID=2593676 RepID=UPI0033F65B53